MKEQQHPIDKLFADKLAAAQQTPRKEAWAKLEGRLAQQQRQRAGAWWYAAAASVAVVALAGWWLVQGPLDSSRQLATRQVEKLPAKTSKFATGGEKTPSETNTIATNQTPVEAQNKSIEAAAPSGKSGNRTPQVGEWQPSIAPTRDLQVPQVAAQQRPSVDDHTTPTANPTVVPSVEPTKPISISNTPTVAYQQTQPVAPVLKENNTTIVMNLNESQSSLLDTPLSTTETTKTKKSSKLVRLFKQIRNAKDGEKVDWKEVGFDPTKILARADEKWDNEPKQK